MGAEYVWPHCSGYDCASVMSGSRNGVQAKVREKYPNVTYVHCRSRVLNLAVSSGCNNVSSIRNPIGEESNHVNATLSKCSPQIFPTLHKIFTIFLTTPVGSVSCEHSFSALRRLQL